MSQIVETPTKTFTAGGAIAKHLLVKFSSGKLAIAGANEEFIGTLEEAAFADGDLRAVRLRSAQGTIKCVASASLAQGSVVYGQAGGKVSNNATATLRVGTAMEAAGADGDIIEVMPDR